MGDACSLRCGSDLCRLPAQRERTEEQASAAEPHAMSTAPAGKTVNNRHRVIKCIVYYGHPPRTSSILLYSNARATSDVSSDDANEDKQSCSCLFVNKLFFSSSLTNHDHG